MRRWVSLLMAGVAGVAIAAEPVPDGEFENSACIECHQQRDAELVAAWRTSVHSTADEAADCVACHGTSHDKAASRARRDGTCTLCHGGGKAPVVHSYATSKHGVLTRLEQDDWDWNRPLVSANYRAPGCAYCHMHNGAHDIGQAVRAWSAVEQTAAGERERVQDVTRGVCQDCHSPRYISRLFESGERMLDIGRMKVREAAVLVEQARERFSPAVLEAVEKQFETMKFRHLKNVYLGIAHQSPDYQWWHGQPALDGDLIRIRGLIDRAGRLQALGD